MVKSKKKEIEGKEGDGGKVRIGGKMENSAGNRSLLDGTVGGWFGEPNVRTYPRVFDSARWRPVRDLF